ncbi:MAG: hypothetical protein Q7U82_14855 [Gammaproteobacteria bacterium]|nr:hypothetical protein [Gammaproteobacteria bacterium]
METHTTSHGLSLKKRVTLFTSFLILLLPMVVVADVCTYEKTVSFTVLVDAVQRLSIRAETGALAVHALPAQDGGQDEVRVEARVCSARKAYLDDMDVAHALNGDVLLVQAVIPEIESAFWINHYPYIDLDIGIPAGLAVTIKDSSGDIQVSGTGTLRIDDGSGGINVRNIVGDVTIEDGSGEINVEQVDGAVDIRDGSGSIDISHVMSSVVVDDGSGELRIAQVGGTVSISDGSGSIDVMDVEQAVTILEDGSGSTEYRNITGDIFLP